MRKAILPLFALALGAAPALNAQLSWASKDVHYAPDAALPAPAVTDTLVDVWQGERLGAVALFRVPKGQHSVARPRVSGPIKGEASFVDYTLTDDYRACGVHPTDLKPWRVPDIIDNRAQSVLLDGESRPVWVTVEVPRGMKPGVYTDTLTVDGQSLALNIRVSPWTLPEGKERKFHLNLWQQPYSVARYGGVKPWTPEHFRLLEPYAKFLARAGQSTISTILFFEPWGEQSNDLFQPMVETVRTADGRWRYDYTVFDRWVEFMDRNGVDGLIECFTMIPWEMKFRYFDEASNDYKFLKTTTSTPEYRDLWLNFLRAFSTHLKEKGWFERTMISMDERSLEDMRNALAIINEAEPNFKVSLAGNYHAELSPRLHSYTITLGQSFPPGLPEERRAKGQITNLYTCCSAPEPNLFSNSAPADAAWIPVYCTATGHDGYLHWSFMNWTDNPLADTRFKLFAPGDTYFIYPEGRSSVRYERLVEGIELSEKVAALTARFIANGNAAALNTLNAALNPIRTADTKGPSSTSATVRHLSQVVAALSAAYPPAKAPATPTPKKKVSPKSAKR